MSAGKERYPWSYPGRAMQSEGMTKNLAPQHRPSMIAEVQRLRGVLEDMPLQLYAQFMTLSHVEWTVIALFKGPCAARKPRSVLAGNNII